MVKTQNSGQPSLLSGKNKTDFSKDCNGQSNDSLQETINISSDNVSNLDYVIFLVVLHLNVVRNYTILEQYVGLRAIDTG